MLEESNVNYPNLNNTDRIIIKSRMIGEAVCDINKSELSILSDVCIFKISAISGFSLPSSEKYADILNEEFLIMLNEYGFSELTFEEIISAFRINAQGNYRTNGGDTIGTVIPYSTFFSINYAAAVLNNYVRIRKCGEYKIVEKTAYQKAEKYNN